MADTTLYKQIVLEWGQDTDSLLWGMGYSPDNGEHFYVLNTTYGRKYRTEDGDRIWPFIVDKVKAVLDWSNITNEPDLALKTDLTWSNVTGKPDVALKSDVAAVSAVASNASAKATSNAATIASVSSTANSALSVANSNAKVLPNKLDKADLTWSNITNRPDFDKIASQASQAVVTANTAQSQASAAGQAAASASTQASAAKTTADTATATANAAKASASTASATAASAQQVANSASASASATAVALKNKADTDTVNAQFTAVNSSVASAQSTADNAVAGLAGKLDKTALTWGNIANKPTNLATTDSVAKAQSAANSAVSVANGAVTTANSAKSAATSAVGVANTANTTANTALTKANSAATVASQANSTANQAVTTASQANSNASSAVSIANSANNSASSAVNTANQAKSTANDALNRVSNLSTGDRNLARGTSDSWTDYVFVTDGGTNRTISLSWVYIDGLKAGDVLTCGITIKNTGITAGTMRVQGSGNATGWNDGSYYSPKYDIASAIPSGTTKELVYTITLTANMIKNSFWDVNIRTDNVPKGGTLSYKCFFVKKGNIPTGWSPAPEDIQSEIDANKTAAANAQTSASNAQNTANSALSKANSNATALNNKVNKSDLTWANISGKPSIPNADDTTTVSSGDLNNYTTTGKYYMPNGLSQYTNHPTTGTDMGDWFVMKVDAYHSSDMIVQTIYQINSGDVWIRQRWSNSWKSWRQINFWG
ncbi:hypothetical protein [Limosilactobacillus mucosae]|uniref:hypothetical protein n=1 Tax=Limosilactobacillus mucosae TaxID=97478 RepID=UPI003D021E93